MEEQEVGMMELVTISQSVPGAGVLFEHHAPVSKYAMIDIYNDKYLKKDKM